MKANTKRGMQRTIVLLAACLASATTISLVQIVARGASGVIVLPRKCADNELAEAAHRRLHVVTITSDRNSSQKLDTMLAIAHKSGLDIEVVVPTTFHGTWAKLKVAREYCAQLVAAGSGTDIVLFTDAFDAVLRGPADAILDQYSRTVHNKEMLLFASEAHCYPGERRACENDGKWYTANRASNTLFQYLNSGGWMGPAYLALLIIDERYDITSAEYSRGVGDQGLWQDILLDSPYRDAIMLDHQATIFRTLFVTESDLACHPGRGWVSRQTQQYAFQFHANGNPKIFFEDVLLPSFEKALQSEDSSLVVCPDPVDGQWCPEGDGQGSWKKHCSIDLYEPYHLVQMRL